MELQFRDRQEAGKMLAQSLGRYALQKGVVVLALSESAIPVAFEVAEALSAPLDLFTVRELFAPNTSDFPFAAIASGVQILEEEIVRKLSLPESFLRPVLTTERRKLERRERSLRGERSAARVRGCTIILVDDGLASGSMVRTAVCTLRERGASAVIAATPVAHPEVCGAYLEEVDDFACVIMPHSVWAANLWYEDDRHLRTNDLRRLLDQAAARPQPASYRGRASLDASAAD